MSDTNDQGHAGESGDQRRSHNLELLERQALLAGTVARTVVVVGAVGVLAWVWLMTRQQITASRGIGFGFDDDSGLNMFERLDLVSQYMSLLLYSVLAIAAGLSARVYASGVVHNAGGVLDRPPLRRRIEADRGWGAYE